MFKKIITFKVPVWFAIALIGSLLLTLLVVTKTNDRSNKAIKSSPNTLNRKPKGDLQNPDSKVWQDWGRKVSVEEASKNMAFNLKLPSGEDAESLAGKLEAVVIEGAQGSDLSKRKSKVAQLFFRSGVRVQQSVDDIATPPPTKLDDYKQNPQQYEEMKRDWQDVEINGVTGMGYEPINKETMDGIYRAPGAVTWYKDKVLYSVIGNGSLPLEKLIKIASLFN